MRKATLVTMFLCSSTQLAQAQSSQGLTWNAPPRCPDANAVMARAHEAGLQGVLPAWWAVADVQRTQRGTWQMRMRIEVGGDQVTQGRRASTCAALAQLAGVDLALVLNAHSTPSAPPPPTPPSPSPPPPVSSPIVAPLLTPSMRDNETAASARVVTVMPPEVPRTWRVTVRADAAGVFGLVPGVGTALGAHAGVSWTDARIELGARWLFEQTIEGRVGGVLVPVAVVGATIFSLRLCGRIVPSRWSFEGCASVLGGWLDARAQGVVTPGSPTRPPWAGTAVGGVVAWSPHDRVALGVGLDAAWVFARPFVVVENYGQVHQVGAIAVAAHVGATLSL